MEKRLDWIDVSKGIGILLVILGHCFNKDTYIHNWIFSFHMPLFFILSGYVFRIEKYPDFRTVVYRKSKSLLVPFAKFWIVAFFLTLAIPFLRSNVSAKDILVLLYTGWPGPINMGSIWFLLSLFICTVVYYVLVLIGKKIGKSLFVPLMIALSGIIGIAISFMKSAFYDSGKIAESNHAFLPGNRLPLTIDTCFTAIVFFYIGIQFVKLQKNVLNTKFILMKIIISSLISVAVSLFLNTRVNLHGCTLGNPFYFYLAALSGSVLIIMISKKICSSEFFMVSSIKKFFCFYGRNSLLVLGVQSFGIHLCVDLLNILSQKQYVLYETVPYEMGIPFFIANAFIFFPVCYIINKKLPKAVRI